MMSSTNTGNVWSVVLSLLAGHLGIAFAESERIPLYRPIMVVFSPKTAGRSFRQLLFSLLNALRNRLQTLSRIDVYTA